MKKSALKLFFALAVFAAFFLTAPALVFADDPPPAPAAGQSDLRVYSNEPIGAGQLIYHVRACKMQEVIAPMTCTRFTPSAFDSQCKPRGTLSEGTQIKGCVGDDNQDTPWKDVSDTLDACRDDPSQQDLRYGYTWAVLQTRQNGAELSPENYTIQGTIVSDTEPSMEEINSIYPGGVARKLFSPRLCGVWDKPEGGGESEGLDEINSRVPEAFNIANSLIGNGCNNDNFSEVKPYSLNGEAVPPMVSCNLVERISGRGGVDVFGQYAAALFRWAGGIVGIICVLVIVVSGAQISMSGDAGSMDEAKKRIFQSLLGLAILFLSGLILYVINPGFFT